MTGGLPLLVAGLQSLVALAPGEPVPPGANAPERDTVRIRDDAGRTLVLQRPPRRIVSLVPAVTEILFALGAGERMVGRTRYGVHPPEARRVPSVGGGVRPSLERVVSRRPDVVVLFAGPDNRETLGELERVGLPTLALRHNDLEDLFRNLRRMGELTGRTEEARRLGARLRCRLEAVSRLTRAAPRRRVYYEVWSDPPITVGAGSYLDTLIAIAGGRNVFGHIRAPSPRVGPEAIVAADPDVILLSRRGDREGGLPPTERPGWESLSAVRNGAVRRVDGDLVHRLGPRLGDAARALAARIHPELEEEIARIAARECDGPANARGEAPPARAPR